MELRLDHTRITSAELGRHTKRLTPYLGELRKIVKSESYDAPESSIVLPSDISLIDETIKLAKELAGKKLKTLIVVGIGGSNLGTKAVYDALRGFDDGLNPDRGPKCVFADTVHPEFLASLEDHLKTLKSADEVLVNIVSKSGGTTETVADAEIITDILVKKFGLQKTKSRFVVTTDVGSKLWLLAEAEGIARLGIPSTVGGRYSVLSAVGLFPLAVLGFDVRALSKGATAMRDLCLSANGPAIRSAAGAFHLLQKGKTIHDTFVFHPELESLGKWVRQLVGESLGKEKNLDGDTVRTGMTPTVSVGSTDLHSVGQLYLGGPRDKFTTFVWAKHPRRDVRIQKKAMWPLVKGVHGKRGSEILSAIRQGVAAAYDNQKLPFSEISFDTISESEIGAFMQFKMMETMLIGKLLHVNTFDQPNVELYKIETKRILHG